MNVVISSARGSSAGINIYQIAIDYWTSPSAYSTTPLIQVLLACPKWLRVNVSSTTVTVYVSQDGRNWTSLGTETIATHVGAITEYGLSVRGSTNNAFSNSLISYFSTMAPN